MQAITKSDYINFVNANTKTGVSGEVYMWAIGQLEDQIKEPIFNSYSLNQLNALYKRLLKNGDLYDFNAQTKRFAPSAAIRKLIEFYNTAES